MVVERAARLRNEVATGVSRPGAGHLHRNHERTCGYAFPLSARGISRPWWIAFSGARTVRTFRNPT